MIKPPINKQTNRSYTFLYWLIPAILLRLWLAPMRGHVHDVAQLQLWMETAVSTHPLAIYSYSSANYPPFALWPLITLAYIYQQFFSPEFALGTPILTALVKLPAIIADVGTAVTLYYALRASSGQKQATLVATLYLYNPAIWYVSAWWGQLEALYTWLMLLAMLTLAHKRIGLSGGLLAAAIFIKPHAAVLLPIWFIRSWQHGQWSAFIKGGTAALLITSVALAPFAWVGQVSIMWAKISALAGRQLFLTMNAHNLWYLLTCGRGSFAAREMANPLLDTTPLLGPLTGWQLGLFLLAGWTLFICYWLWSRPFPQAIYLAATAFVIGFFLLPAESHERYLFPVFVFLSLLWGQRPFIPWLYLSLSLTFWLNLWWVDAAIPTPWFSQQLGWGVPIAFLNVSLALYLVWHIIKTRGWQGTPLPTSASANNTQTNFLPCPPHTTTPSPPKQPQSNSTN